MLALFWWGAAVTQLPTHWASGHSDAACVLLSPGQCSCRVASPSSHLKPLHWSRGQSERRNTPPRRHWRCRTQLPKLRGTAGHRLGRGDTCSHAPRQALGRGPEFHPERGGQRFPGREMEKHSRGDSTKGESAQHNSDVPFSRCRT